MTAKQALLAKKYGTPGEFYRACFGALGEISVNEAQAAYRKYKREWDDAGPIITPPGPAKLLRSHVELKKWLHKRMGDKIVLTNGCFDLIHAGHLHLLREAKKRGHYLLVLINSDASVRKLKGDGRPVNRDTTRAALLCELDWVDAVFVFATERIDEWIRIVRPAVWIKGGDYRLKTLDPEEVRQATLAGTSIEIIARHGKTSTTKIHDKIKRTLGKDHRRPHSKPKTVRALRA